MPESGLINNSSYAGVQEWLMVQELALLVINAGKGF